MNNKLPQAHKLLTNRLTWAQTKIKQLNVEEFLAPFGSTDQIDLTRRIAKLKKERSKINADLKVIRAMNKGAVK